MNNRIILFRIEYQLKETLGDGFIYNGRYRIFEYKNLELPWLNNQNEISCIPAAIYPLHKIISPTHGECFQIMNVPGRDNIQIHAGNYYTDILGCQLPGSEFADINHDNITDVINSKATLTQLLSLMPNKSTIEIYGKY